jgi:hypothetical protein
VLSIAPRHFGCSTLNYAFISAEEVPLSKTVEAEVSRMRGALNQLIELSGLSRRVVERRLCEQGCGTDLGRLLSGRLELKVTHVIAICRVIELEPLEFVQIALKPRPVQRSPLLRRLEALLPYAREPVESAAPPKALEVAGLLHRVDVLVEQIGELTRAAARLAGSESTQKHRGERR